MLRTLLWSVLALAPLAAEAAAGKVLFALGRVEIQRDGQVLPAPRGTAVEVGDTITTGPTGMAQVRLQDGGLLSLRYGSSMRVEDFRMPAPAASVPVTPGAAAPAPAGGGRSVLRLLRGAFRTITGAIGRNASDTYSVVTPVATIGIRGTDYSAAFCNGDCGKTPDGLYVGVSNGGVEVNNGAGQLVLGNDQYGYVKDSSTAPDRELAPPDVLETPIEGSEEGEGEESGEGTETASRDEAGPDGGFTEETAESRSLDDGDRQPEGDYELRPGTAGTQASASPGVRVVGQGEIYLSEGRAMGGFLIDGQVSTIGTAANFNVGGDAATGLRWGRWHGGIASIAGTDVDLTAASLHWIYAPVVAPVLPISGTQSYRLIGNTDPTGSDGSVGFLGDATLFADFTNQTVDSTLSVGFGDVASGGTLWQASGSGSIQDGLFDGSYSTVTVNGDPTGTSGAFSGFFTPEAAAAGLVFELGNGQITVNGAVGFEAGGGGGVLPGGGP